jgi:hypothetical protein
MSALWKKNLKNGGGRTADVLPPLARFSRMKTENKETRSDNTLENLDAKKREWILEFACNTRLLDVVKVLKNRGIETSPASVSRFVQRHREKKLMDSRAESKATVNELAEGAKDGRLREGTLEAVRQRLYERALESQSPEEARELYAELVKEEAKLRELALKERQVAIAEEQLKLEALVARAKLAGTGMVKGKVIDSKAEPGAIAEAEVKQLGGPSANEQRLAEVVRLATEILNRGGAAEERLLEARCVLAEACGAT